MKKRQYIIPLVEVEQISLTGMLMSSPIAPEEPPMPDPSHPGAPKRRTPVF